MTDPSQAQQDVEQIADAVRATRAHVVRPVRCAARDERTIGQHRVAHIRDVTPRFEVADPQDGLSPSIFDLDQLSREGRRRVVRVLSRARMVERPGQQNLSGEARPSISCASLLMPYGLVGFSGCVFASAVRGRPIDERGAGDENRAREAELAAPRRAGGACRGR